MEMKREPERGTMLTEIMMKIYFVLCSIFFASAAFAANQNQLNQGNMQNMMKVMQEVQQCMESIDQAKLSELQTRSETFQKELDALCSQGQRDQAQKQAMAFGREMASDPTMKQMRRCGEMAQGALPMMDMGKTYDEKEYANKHVCDE